MDWTQIISLILNAVFGGGFLITLVTLRASRKKANAEADAQQLGNAQLLIQEYQKNIVEPLKKEINALRKTVGKLTGAINRITDCPHSVDCPVRNELQKQQDSEQ